VATVLKNTFLTAAPPFLKQLTRKYRSTLKKNQLLLYADRERKKTNSHHSEANHRPGGENGLFENGESSEAGSSLFSSPVFSRTVPFPGNKSMIRLFKMPHRGAW
jgi:hypothetical protein